MNFRASFCDPFQNQIIELGKMSKSGIIEKFEQIPWMELLEKMNRTNEQEIYYSPSLRIENAENKHGLEISAVGNPDNFEFYIFYKRPKKIKSFFGLKEKMNENYITNITGQTKQDVLECLDALFNNDAEFLSNNIGR